MRGAKTPLTRYFRVIFRPTTVEPREGLASPQVMTFDMDVLRSEPCLFEAFCTKVIVARALQDFNPYVVKGKDPSRPSASD